MALGEFEFDDLYSAHADDVFSLAFTMALLGTMLMRLPSAIICLICKHLFQGFILTPLERMSCEPSTHAVGLALLGALVFVNLFVALIVSDISQLQHSAELQKLVNTAQHIVVFESLFKAFRCCRPMFKTRKPIKDIVRICPHRMCRCGRDGNENRSMTPDIVEGLR